METTTSGMVRTGGAPTRRIVLLGGFVDDGRGGPEAQHPRAPSDRLA